MKGKARKTSAPKTTAPKQAITKTSWVTPQTEFIAPLIAFIPNYETV